MVWSWRVGVGRIWTNQGKETDGICKFSFCLTPISQKCVCKSDYLFSHKLSKRIYIQHDPVVRISPGIKQAFSNYYMAFMYYFRTRISEVTKVSALEPSLFFVSLAVAGQTQRKTLFYEVKCHMILTISWQPLYCEHHPHFQSASRNSN